MDFTNEIWVRIGGGLIVFVVVLMGLLNASDRWSKASEFRLAAMAVGIPTAFVGLITLALGILNSDWEIQTVWLFIGGVALAVLGWAASPSTKKGTNDQVS